MAKKSMSEKLYKDSPEMKRDDESGKMSVKKKEKGEPTEAEKESARVSDGTAGMPVHERHGMERADMIKRHEAEHKALGDAERADVHARHSKEYSDMLKRHDKDYASTGSGGGKEKIKKVEKGE